MYEMILNALLYFAAVLSFLATLSLFLQGEAWEFYAYLSLWLLILSNTRD